LGNVDKGSKFIVIPKKGRADKIVPVLFELTEMHKATGNGTIFPDKNGIPKLHCHIICGRGEKTICGEIRSGIRVWHVLEVIIGELIGCKAIRKLDKLTGFELLQPDKAFR
jgi:predicted DNA-binding protein with PD1-like motif